MSMTVFDLFNAAWPFLGPLVLGFLLGLLAREIIRAIRGHRREVRGIDRSVARERMIQRGKAKYRRAGDE